jgi:hypothetical protein
MHHLLMPFHQLRHRPPVRSHTGHKTQPQVSTGIRLSHSHVLLPEAAGAEMWAGMVALQHKVRGM